MLPVQNKEFHMIWIEKNHVNMTNQSQSHDLAKKRTCESAK
jgi:hypothetical protein